MSKITIDRAVVEQALEALELAYAGADVITVHGKAITALRAALNKPQRPDGMKDVYASLREKAMRSRS